MPTNAFIPRAHRVYLRFLLRQLFLTVASLLIMSGCTSATDTVSRSQPPAESSAPSRPLIERTDRLDIAAALAGDEPLFVSDYFSFVGADDKGHVAFAIDNDRARRGKKFTADAHVFLHAEGEGWIKVAGAGDYENRKKELIPIPDSEVFHFSGSAATGITLSSQQNRLTLDVEPVRERLRRENDASLYSLGSTPATLTWRDRTIRGRVIYEYIFMKNLSPWYSLLSGLFYNDFQGIYLMTEKGDDLYLHSSKGTSWSTMVEPLVGFLVRAGLDENLDDLGVEVTDRRFGFGFYRWPQAWNITWKGKEGTGTLVVKVVDRKTVTNWLIGGFAMATIQGTMTYAGETQQVYGLAELIR